MGNTFSEHGYEIVQGDITHLRALRERIYKIAVEALGDPAPVLTPKYAGLLHTEKFFNGFHKGGLEGPALNKLRLQLQRSLTGYVGPMLFEAFPRIGELVGADVVQQKGCNLVIAMPGDTDHVPTHRDAPLNSNFEVVCWVPLVDCFGTKSMRILNRIETKKALELLLTEGYKAYHQYAIGHGSVLWLEFGSACLFWAGLVHTVVTNSTQETRWSLNHRYKNYWAPYGEKGSGYFEPLRLSPLTEVGIS